MSKKIPIKRSSLYRNDLATIFKVNLDKKGFSSWEQFTDEIGVDNRRTFIDWFNGKQAVKKEVLEKAFDILGINKELIKIYCKEEVKYTLLNNKE